MLYFIRVRPLQGHPDLMAIYNADSGTEGVGYALHACGSRQSILFVGHELTDESSVLLSRGIMTMTIDQASELQARRAIDLKVNRMGTNKTQSVESETSFTLHKVENL